MDAATVSMIGGEVPHILQRRQAEDGRVEYLLVTWLLEESVALIALKQLEQYRKQLGIGRMGKDSRAKKRAASSSLRSARKPSKKPQTLRKGCYTC